MVITADTYATGGEIGSIEPHPPTPAARRRLRDLMRKAYLMNINRPLYETLAAGITE